MGKRRGPSRWIDGLILVGAGLFLFALILSAVYEPRIRVLHTLQALIYVAVIVLTRKKSAWGFGAGFLISVFWNYINLFVTTFIKNGLEQLFLSLRTGQLHRPDLVLAVVAAGGHFLLVAACLIGFVGTRPGTREFVRFAAGGVLALAYFVAIIVTTGSQYVGLMKRVFGL